MSRPINFVLDRSDSYAGVQDQLLGLIDAQLPTPASRGDYVPGALNLSLFIRERADVVMSHGVADKNYLWTSDAQGKRLANQREHLLVPGEWLKRRLLASKPIHLSAEQIHVVGWPRLDLLIGQVPTTPRRSIGSAKPRILWAPTHNRRRRGETGRSTSSFPAFENYLRTLSRFAWIDVSVHPRNRTDRTPTGASMPRADIVVADFGTTVYEAWALGKPVIFPRWLLADRIAEYMPSSAESHIFSERIGYHPDSFDELVDIVRSGPVLTPDVRSFMDDYLAPQYFGASSARVAEVLSAIAAQPRTRRS
jgi:hypothetical protein